MGFTNDECDDRKSTMLWLVCNGSDQPVRFGSPPARRRRTDGERLQDSRGRGSAIYSHSLSRSDGHSRGSFAQRTDLRTWIMSVGSSAEAVTGVVIEMALREWRLSRKWNSLQLYFACMRGATRHGSPPPSWFSRLYAAKSPPTVALKWGQRL